MIKINMIRIKYQANNDFPIVTIQLNLNLE